jgi:hypothetical protein
MVDYSIDPISTDPRRIQGIHRALDAAKQEKATPSDQSLGEPVPIHVR